MVHQNEFLYGGTFSRFGSSLMGWVMGSTLIGCLGTDWEGISFVGLEWVGSGWY